MMNDNDRKVVVTGMGVICCGGRSVGEFWNSICEGRDCIREITRFDTSRHKIKRGGEVAGFQPENGLDFATAFAVEAARQAVDQAGLAADLDGTRAGIVLGTNFGAVDVACDAFRRGAPPAEFEKFCFMHTINEVARRLNFRGIASCLSLSCASGNAAIGYALDMIRSGVADVMIAGGYDAITEFSWSGLSALHTMTTEKVRPFDKNRSQTIFSEGAGVLLLEEANHALARGAEILAEVAGHGFNNNAFHMTHPDGGGYGMLVAMRMALHDAGISPDEIDHINSHGTGTKLNDVAETQAIKSLLGKRAYDVPVNSIKSSIGHVMGAASAVEAVACVMTILEGVIPPTINYETPDPECDLNYVPNKALEKRVDCVLNNAAGIGGCNSAVIFRRWR